MGIPSVFEESASDWRPLQVADFSPLIVRIEPLRQDLNEIDRSSLMNLSADVSRLHDEVIANMEGRPFIVKCRPLKAIRYSAIEEEEFFSGMQTSPIARINDGIETLYTRAGLIEQFTVRHRIVIPDRHSSVYADFLKLGDVLDKLNESDKSFILTLSGSRESEKGWNLHWIFTINVFSVENQSIRRSCIYLHDGELHTVLSRHDDLMKLIDRAKRDGTYSVFAGG